LSAAQKPAFATTTADSGHFNHPEETLFCFEFHSVFNPIQNKNRVLYFAIFFKKKY
jgi:hypothetical protein